MNDKGIGFHEFNVQNDTISNKAQFDVKLWFIPAYKYRHTATEVYKDNCLIQLESETQDGADFFELSNEYIYCMVSYGICRSLLYSWSEIN